MEQSGYILALEALQRGDRLAAFRLARQLVMDDPRSPAAWVLLSALIDDDEHQRECIERALALDPQYAPAHAAMQEWHLRQMLAHDHPPVLNDHLDPQEFGEYLVDRGIITKEQLQDLEIERMQLRARGVKLDMAGVVVKQGMLSVPRVAHLLVEQEVQRLRPRTGFSRHLLGEYLLSERLITTEQLEAALAEQLRRKLAGAPMPLGRLLVLQHVITLSDLQRILNLQTDEGPHALFE